MSFLAQLLGTVFGAIAGFGVFSMAVFVVDGVLVNLGYVGAGVGALIGFGAGYLVARSYEKSQIKDAKAIRRPARARVH
ncbi:MAG: hypothetical protein RIC16_13450 [Rhodospirillales bacterium]